MILNTRLTKACAAFGRHNRNVWNRRDILEATKIKAYWAVIITLLYGCEMWTTYQRHIKKLNHFHMTCLRKTLSITCPKHIPNTEVLTWASLPNIYTILMQSQLCWAGHAVCMKDHCLPKKLLHGELSQGKHSQGGQKKYFKDTLKVSMKSFCIAPNCLEYLAQDRSGMKLSNIKQKSVKPEETQQVNCTGNLEKALPLPLFIFTAQDSSAHRLVSLAICALRHAFPNHKVDQMVLVDYDGQKRRRICPHTLKWVYSSFVILNNFSNIFDRASLTGVWGTNF